MDARETVLGKDVRIVGCSINFTFPPSPFTSLTRHLGAFVNIVQQVLSLSQNDFDLENSLQNLSYRTISINIFANHITNSIMLAKEIQSLYHIPSFFKRLLKDRVSDFVGCKGITVGSQTLIPVATIFMADQLRKVVAKNISYNQLDMS